MAGPTWEYAARCVLTQCKDMSPTFWSVDKFDTLSVAWGAVFASARVSLNFLLAGVTRWYMQDTTGDRPTPGQIIAAAKIERSIWEATPEGQREAERRHREMEDERDKLLAEGRFRPSAAN